MKKLIFSIVTLMTLSGCATVPVELQAVPTAKIESIEIVTSQDGMLLDGNSNDPQNESPSLLEVYGANRLRKKVNKLNEKLGDYDFRNDVVEKVGENFAIDNVKLVQFTRKDRLEKESEGVPRLNITYRLSMSYDYLQINGELSYRVAGQPEIYSNNYVSRIDLEPFIVDGSLKQRFQFLQENPKVLKTSLEVSAKHIASMLFDDLTGANIDVIPVGTAKIPVTRAGSWGVTKTLPIVDERDGYLYLGPSEKSNMRAIVSPSIVIQPKKIPRATK